MVGGLLKPPVNWPKIVEPMPMITASTRIFTPDETTLPSTFSARKAVRPKRPNGTRTNPAKRGQLELDQADKELDRHDEEADDDDQPGDQQDGDLDEIVEEAGETHQTGDGGQDGLSGVDADLGDASRLKKLRRAQRAASGLDPESGEGVVNDLSEVVVVADDEGEDADIERFPDQPGDHVLVGRQRPEETGKRDVDGDEHAGEPADIALDEAKA